MTCLLISPEVILPAAQFTLDSDSRLLVQELLALLAQFFLLCGEVRLLARLALVPSSLPIIFLFVLVLSCFLFLNKTFYFNSSNAVTFLAPLFFLFFLFPNVGRAGRGSDRFRLKDDVM